MADLLRITQLVNPKNYTMPTRPLAQSDTVFDLVDLTKIVKTNDRTEEFRQNDSKFTGNNADAMLDIQLKIAKNPSYTSNLLKGLVNEDMLAKLAASASPDIVNEFNEFAKSIFLSEGNLKSDLIAQGKGITAFEGELFSALRELLANNSSQEFKTALSGFLRNAFSLLSQKEVLTSLSDNFMFLSDSLYPSRSLSQQLSELSKAFVSPSAPDNFQALKEQALKLLDSAAESLVSTDKIKNMISLIKYNLSRFSDNPFSLSDSFRSLSEHAQNSADKDNLHLLFEKFIQGSSLPQSAKNALLSDSNEFYQIDKLVYKLASDAKNHTNGITADSLRTMLETANRQLSETSSLSIGRGSEMIKEMLSSILPNGSGAEISQIMRPFEQTADLNTLINRLSFILNSIENTDIKSTVGQTMNAVLTMLSASPDIVYQPPSSMEKMADFLLKTLGNENIRYLGIVDPNTVVQSMLTAPGVFTPLLHCILPAEVDDIRAYGDLWADAEDSDEKSDTAHMFLSFEIEMTGIFELEIFSSSNNLDIALYCPSGFAETLSGLKGRISQIASNAGYNVKTAKIAPLVKLRSLTDVFPHIAERRAGLNVKI